MSTYRTHLTQSALDKAVSRASQKIFPIVFGPFLDSLGGFEVKSFVEFRGKHKNILTPIGVSF